MKSMTILVTLIFAMTCAASALAQTCNSAVVASTPASRFVNNNNGTVTDSATGLTWKRCIEGQSWDGVTCTGSGLTSIWQLALQTGSAAVFAGANDWRLPNIKELASLVENRCADPAINATIFPATPVLAYWSSSSDAYSPLYAWGVHFETGYTGVWNKDGGHSIRLVRSGQ